jgi:regulator of RNase E activity RraA
VEETISQRPVQRLEDVPPDLAALLTTAVLADSLDALGLRGQVLAPGVTAAWPGARTLGRAATLQFAPTEDDHPDPYRDVIDFMDALAPGSVPVLATAGDVRSAYWGELFSAAALGRGAAGTVCDGPVRDLVKIQALGYPVFAAGCRPIDYRARMRVVSSGRPVRLAGVVVAPGDVVVGDADGLVVVPQAVEQDALTLALKRVQDETSVLGDLLAGASLGEVWQRWGVL